MLEKKNRKSTFRKRSGSFNQSKAANVNYWLGDEGLKQHRELDTNKSRLTPR